MVTASTTWDALDMAFIEYFSNVVRLHARRDPTGLAAQMLAVGTLADYRLLIDEQAHCLLTREFREGVPQRFDRHWVARIDHLIPIGLLEFVWTHGIDAGQEIVLCPPVREALLARFYPLVCGTPDPSTEEALPTPDG